MTEFDAEELFVECVCVPFHPRAETILGPEFETNQITPNLILIFITIIIVINM